MKNFFKNIIRKAKAIAKVSVAGGAVALACFTTSAQQSIPLTIYPLTNSAGFVPTNALQIPTVVSSNINSQPFQIWRGRGFTLNLGVWTTNASGSNVSATLRFAARHKSPSGTTLTNWITTGQAAPITFNFVNNGTTEQFYSTNIPAGTIDNVDLGQLTTVTNAHLSTLFLDPTNSFIGVFP